MERSTLMARNKVTGDIWVQESLSDRVIQFNLMELPGQSKMMHMGTSYLVNDLDREVRRLEGQLEKARCCGSCKWWKWADLLLHEDDECKCAESEWYGCVKCPDESCDKWRARE